MDKVIILSFINIYKYLDNDEMIVCSHKKIRNMV